MSKNILINAYAATNLGDDLFVKILCERYPHTNFTIPSRPKHAKEFKNIPNLKIIPVIPYVDGLLARLKASFKVNRYLNWKAAQKSDGLVYIGGSIFMQRDGWEQETEVFQKQLKDFKAPYYFLGCNFGPFSDEAYVEQHMKIYSNVTDVCFRDQYSYELFSKLSNVRLAPDIVFTYEDTKIEEHEREKVVTISVIDLKIRGKLSPHHDDYKNKLVEISQKLISQHYRVRFMSFCEEEGDEEMVKELVAAFTEEERTMIDTYFYRGNLNEAAAILKKSSYIIATRFHAMILGWVYGVPVYPLIYSDKTYNVIEDTNFTGPYTWINRIEEVDVDKIVNEFLTSSPHDIGKYILEAQKQFTELDKFLN